jgi:hypothetical protein
MKACLVATLTLLVASYSAAQPAYTEKQVIEYAKSVDVKTLDPSLSSQRLEDWLQAGPPHAHIRWDVSDTCDNKPDSDVDYPLCAKIWFSRNGEAGSFLIEVGTRRKGVGGRPQLYAPVLSWEDGPGWIMTGDAERLSELPTLLNQPAFAHSAALLYGEIVARHPIGIPAGAEMSTIRPFLSRRLAEQLQTVKTCQEDYFRQHHQATDRAPKPTWLKSGLFTGDGNRALPVSAWPVRKGPQQDGSFLVYVNLFAQSIDLGNGLKGGAYSPTGNWRVGVKVISEDGQFVVDDVRLFDGPSTDEPSHLLSDSFVGCDGSHWTGLSAAFK